MIIWLSWSIIAAILALFLGAYIENYRARIQRAPPTRDGAEGAGDIARCIETIENSYAFKTHCGIPLRNCGEWIYLKKLLAAPPKQALKDPTQQSGLHQGEPRCLYPGCECSDLRACYPVPPRPAPDAMREALEWIEQHDRFWTSFPNENEVLDRSITGNVLIRGVCGRRAFAALAAPVPSPDGVGVVVDQILHQFENDDRTLYPDFEVILAIEKIQSALLSLSPAVAAEPVAWQNMDDNIHGEKSITVDKGVLEIWQKAGVPIRPLYASPTVRGDRDREAIVMLLNKIAKDKSGIYLSPVCTSAMADAILSFFVQPATRPDREALAQAYALHRWKENLDNLPDDMKDDCYNFAGGFGERK